MRPVVRWTSADRLHPLCPAMSMASVVPPISKPPTWLAVVAGFTAPSESQGLVTHSHQRGPCWGTLCITKAGASDRTGLRGLRNAANHAGKPLFSVRTNVWMPLPTVWCFVDRLVDRRHPDNRTGPLELGLANLTLLKSLRISFPSTLEPTRAQFMECILNLSSVYIFSAFQRSMVSSQLALHRHLLIPVPVQLYPMASVLVPAILEQNSHLLTSPDRLLAG